MAELTIEEARKIYASADSLKDLMLTLFSKEELDQRINRAESDKKFSAILEWEW